MSEVERVKNSFPDQFQELFDFYEKDGYVIAKPKRRIDPETFSEIGKIVRELKGEYVKFNHDTKQGGYFRFKREKRAKLTLLGHLEIVKTEVEYIEKALREGGY
jgi:hypothetical protein